MRFSISILLICGLVGCDAPYGINHTANVAFVPPAERILSIVRATPGVDSAKYDLDAHSQAPEVVNTFHYWGRGNVQGFIQLIRKDDHVRYVHYWRQLGTPLTQQQVDATLSMMRAIEARLETEAGLTGLSKAIVQRCTRVRC